MQDASAELQFLSGIRVVDFTQFEAGPSCTEALAWLGAEVVKIENPKIGDPGRRLRPGHPDDDPYYFQVFNANKKSITVNLKSPRGLELVKDLLRKADVCVENMAPGTIERLGLGYDVVRELNPGIIYCQVKGFGTGSPYEKNLAFDMIAQATGGTISVTGEKGRMPVKPGLSLGDTGTGMTMAITILGALYRRAATGEGHRLQVAMQDAMLHYMRTNFSTQARSGKAVERDGTRSGGGSNAPSGLYPCAPGGPNDYVWIMTSRANPEHWSRLMQGHGPRGTDPRSALRHAARARPARRGARHDHPRMDHDADQARGDGSGRQCRHPRRRRVRHDGADQRPELRAARHHAGHAASQAQAIQDASMAGPRRRQAAARDGITDAGPAHRRGADNLARLSEAEVKALHGEGVVRSRPSTTRRDRYNPVLPGAEGPLESGGPTASGGSRRRGKGETCVFCACPGEGRAASPFYVCYEKPFYICYEKPFYICYEIRNGPTSAQPSSPGMSHHPALILTFRFRLSPHVDQDLLNLLMQPREHIYTHRHACYELTLYSFGRHMAIFRRLRNSTEQRGLDETKIHIRDALRHTDIRIVGRARVSQELVRISGAR